MNELFKEANVHRLINSLNEPKDSVAHLKQVGCERASGGREVVRENGA